MKTSFSEDKEKLFAYLTIHDFFDIYTMADALGFLQSILKAAATKKIWSKGAPFRVLYYVRQLTTLCNTAFYIQENLARRDAAIIKKDKRVDNPGIEMLQASMGKRAAETLWNSFPRHITLQQFYNPYLVIDSFCRYLPQAGWQKALEEIQEYALLGSRITELHPPYNLLSIQRQLARLIEACHLVEVRTNQVKSQK